MRFSVSTADDGDGSLVTITVVDELGSPKIGLRKGYESEFRVKTAAIKKSVEEAPDLPSPRPDGAGSLAAELESLAELHRKGTLSDAEFAAAKRTLIGE
jgi:hypothetical protein